MLQTWDMYLGWDQQHFTTEAHAQYGQMAYSHFNPAA